MTTLSFEAAALVASLCGGGNIDANLMVKDAFSESGLRTEEVGPVNKNGTRDWGITQINSDNFPLLNVNAASLIDQTPITVEGHSVERGACVAFRAQGDLLRMLSRYNAGRPDSLAGQAYAHKVLSGVARASLEQGEPSGPASQTNCPPTWDTFSYAVCMQQHGDK